MSVTISSLFSNFNTYVGDSSTDRITDAERYQYLTEATAWLLEELGNEHMVSTYAMNYLDGIHKYKITSSVADLLIGADLRREEEFQTQSFTRKSPREIAEDIGQGSGESSWAVERTDGDAYLIVNHNSRYLPKTISDFDSLTSAGGTWALDAVTSDGTNLTVDTNEMKQGSASLNFDVTVAQSGNNRATLSNSTLTSMDLSDYENLGTFSLWVYIPVITNFSSVTLYWGSSDSAYTSLTKTTDHNGSAFVVGWNRLTFDWASGTVTGSPDFTAVDYCRIDFNYAAGYSNTTDFRVDDLVLVRPEKLTFHYISYNVGFVSTSDSTEITAFTATTNVPFFSGRYDQYRHPVAHKAASLAFLSLRLRQEALDEDNLATAALTRAEKLFESSKVREMKSFKVFGVSFNKHRRR